jgi:hypothetical protein
LVNVTSKVTAAAIQATQLKLDERTGWQICWRAKFKELGSVFGETNGGLMPDWLV